MQFTYRLREQTDQLRGCELDLLGIREIAQEDAELVRLHLHDLVLPACQLCHSLLELREVQLDRGVAKLGRKQLTPGLPAEVFIQGKKRRVITYLTQPLVDQMALTFREE